MTHFVRLSETTDYCPACGALHVSAERGHVVAHRADGRGVCDHTYQQRNAMRTEALKQLRVDAHKEQAVRRGKRRHAAA